jgi:cyclohexa-1,5-dienecarbonyl-CoA hydratase
MTQKEYENITFEIKADTAYLTINRPPVNVLNIAAMKDMNDAISSLTGNTDVKILVITGNGEKAFSAGVDVADHTDEKVEDMIRVFHDIFRNMANLDQVTVAAIKGLTLGGGCEVAIFCDLIIAADNVKIGQPEIKLAVFPPIALLVMPQMIGMKRAAELLLTGKIIQSSEALDIGLVNKVVPLDSFEPELEEFLKPIRELSLVGLNFSKKGMYLGHTEDFLKRLEQIEKIYLEDMMASEDAHEGLKAFLEKRPPVWKNK